MSETIIIKRVRWTGDNLREIIDFIGLHESAEKWTWEEYEQVVSDHGLKIFTDKGTIMANIGDYVEKDSEGNFVLRSRLTWENKEEI